MNNKITKFGAVISFILVLAISAIPTPAPGSIGAAVGTELQGATDNVLGMLLVALPIALSVFAAIWGVRKAMRFFKGAAN
jgi:hypothetical protein